MRLRCTIRHLLWLTMLAGAVFVPSTRLLCEDSGGPDNEAIRRDLDCLQGKWEIVEASNNGKDITDEYKKVGITITFRNDVWIAGTLASQSSIAETSIIKLNPSKQPKEFDHVMTLPIAGSDKTVTIVHPGIYELEDEVLKLCISNDERKRPNRFTSYDKSFYVAIFRRVPAIAKAVDVPPDRIQPTFDTPGHAIDSPNGPLGDRSESK